MTMPSSREVPQEPSPKSPRGIWTVRFPAPGVYAHMQGVRSNGRLLIELYPQDEDEVVAAAQIIVAALDRLDPAPIRGKRPHLVVVAG